MIQEKSVFIKRESYVDTVKVFAILSVVLGHIASPFGKFIFSWHMPLFFFLSGFFIKIETKSSIFVQKNFKRLIIPYFIFGFLGLILGITKAGILNRELSYFNEFLGLFYYMDYSYLKNHYGSVLWFLPTLFFGRIIIFLLIKNVKNYFLIFLVLILLIFTIIKINFLIPFGIDKAILSSLWIYVGYLYFNNKIQKKSITYALLMFCFLFLIFNKIPILDVANKNLENPLINYIYSLSFIFLIITIFREIYKKLNNFYKLNNFFMSWGQETMFIFIVHAYTNHASYIIVERYIANAWCLRFILSLLLIQMLLIIKKRYSNFFLFKYV